MRREIDFITIHSDLCDLEKSLRELQNTVNTLLDDDVNCEGADRSVLEYIECLEEEVIKKINTDFRNAINACDELERQVDVDDIMDFAAIDCTLELGTLCVEITESDEDIIDSANAVEEEKVASAATHATNN